jgi:hypothetical protein
VTFLNYGYWPPEGETLTLKPEDESNRPAIQLYHHVASGWDLADKNVLEVSCGHGGGASFVKRYHKPASYTAIDQNPKAIDFNRKTHGSLDIDFRTGVAGLIFPPIILCSQCGSLALLSSRIHFSDLYIAFSARAAICFMPISARLPKPPNLNVISLIQALT